MPSSTRNWVDFKLHNIRIFKGIRVIVLPFAGNLKVECPVKRDRGFVGRDSLALAGAALATAQAKENISGSVVS